MNARQRRKQRRANDRGYAAYQAERDRYERAQWEEYQRAQWEDEMMRFRQRRMERQERERAQWRDEIMRDDKAWSGEPF